jgi:hypothetical protein
LEVILLDVRNFFTRAYAIPLSLGGPKDGISPCSAAIPMRDNHSTVHFTFYNANGLFLYAFHIYVFFYIYSSPLPCTVPLAQYDNFRVSVMYVF